MRRRHYYLRGKKYICGVFIAFAAMDKHFRKESIYWNCFNTLIDPSVIFINSFIIGYGAESLQMAGEMADEECTQKAYFIYVAREKICETFCKEQWN